MRSRYSCLSFILVGVGATLVLSDTAIAAPRQSGEIVQPLPPQASHDLREALQRLARKPSDLEALLDAGEASLKLGDVAAAEGFFTRAQAISPADGRAILGQGRVSLRVGHPVKALQQFAQAERAGIDPEQMAGNRALAYDLVGRNSAAQKYYRSALEHHDSADLRRQYAISLAISGDRKGFEKALYPLLAHGDFAAFRSRAFGLAILGESEQAVAIAETMMPADQARIMAAYLRYMPQLTKAEQAAAANLGLFPSLADIEAGKSRDLARTDSEQGDLGRVAEALAPAGETLGTNPVSTSAPISSAPRRRPDRTEDAPVAQPKPSVNTSATAHPSLAEAFAGLPSASTDIKPEAGAVDISSIKPPREVERAEPVKPLHPERHWVQVATGQDRSALSFDWRRIAEAANGLLKGHGPYVADWGETNRLLAGPFESDSAAQEMVNKLNGMGVDSFPFTSAEGEAVESLD